VFSSWPSTQSRLVRRAAEGDARAFRTLYRALHPAVHGYVGRRVATPADVEDLVARVFHRVVENLARFDASKASVRGWVLGITRNAVIDHLRTRREIVALEDGPELLAVVDPIADGPDPRTAAILAGVRELPASTREMIALHFADGLSYREIAELVGSTEAAVKQRMARALRELRTLVREPEPAKGAARYAI
jgi:RNA polymerase sigma-70 factor (ECF subfamily)